MAMQIPYRLLFAFTLFCCSMVVLNRAISLHTDPWDAEAFAAEQAKAKGVEWPQLTFRENAGKLYEATFQAADGSGRYAEVEVKKTDAGWQLVSFEQGTAEWRKRVKASR